MLYLKALVLLWTATTATSSIIDKRETPCIALGDCPGEPKPVSSVTPVISHTTSPAPVVSSAPAVAQPKPASKRTLCSQDECARGLCDLGNDGDTDGPVIANDTVSAAFYENSDPDKFPYGLLAQSYTRNVCPSSPPTNTYIWKPFTNRQSAAGLQALCGCTTIFILSPNGAFSSHLWEEDKANDPPRDLQLANYQATLSDLRTALTGGSVPAGALQGGDAFLILPVDPENPANLLYDQRIVNGLINTIQSSTGIQPTTTRYTPLDLNDPALGTDRRGTAGYQYDPNYENPENNEIGRAYRVYSESTLLRQRTGL